MGTRSLIGYELPNGKIYVQYQQFDGYPEGKGRAYYLGVLTGLMELRTTAFNKKGGPSRIVFKRIKHYLDEMQYASGHSIGNHFVATKEDWHGIKIDSWQEWQYLFTRKGDFVFFHVSEDRYKVTIPWAITRACLKERNRDILNALSESEFWASLKFDDRSENEMVLSWGKDVALHISDDLDYESSKLLRDKLLKGWEAKIVEPILNLKTFEVLAFPDQGDRGWREGLTMNVNGKIVHSTFLKQGKCRNEKEFSYAVEHIGSPEKAKKLAKLHEREII